MASIWKHPKSRYWSACFTDLNGRQLKRSTKRTDRNEALVIAQNFEFAERQARDGLLTEGQCRSVLSDILQKATGETIRDPAAKQYLNDWLNAKEASVSASTGERYRHTIKLFLDHLGKKAGRPLSTISAQDIQAFAKARMTEGLAPKTVRVDIKTLNVPFYRAQRTGVIPVNPVSSVELPRGGSSTRDTFTEAQVKLLLEAATLEWQTTILLGFYLGARLSDCVNMRWSNVNLTAHAIAYTPSKTQTQTADATPVTVPLHPTLYAQLLNLASTDQPVEFLSPSLANRGTEGKNGLSAQFIAIMEQAEISPKSAKGKGKRNFSKLSFHSLRHSFNSALANQGVPQELRMRLTGHRSAAMNDRYTHHEVEVLREAIEKMPHLG